MSRAFSFCAASLSPATWDAWRGLVPDAARATLLGAAAARLKRYWPSARWEEPIGPYLDLSLDALLGLHGMGRKKLDTVVAVVHDLTGLPAPLSGPPTTVSAPPPDFDRLDRAVVARLDEIRTAPDVRAALGRIQAALLDAAFARAAWETERRHLDRDRAIVEARLHGRPLDEIAEEHGLSRERVRQLVIVCRRFLPERERWAAALQRRLYERVAVQGGAALDDDVRAQLHITARGMLGASQESFSALAAARLNNTVAAELRRASLGEQTPIPAARLLERLRRRASPPNVSDDVLLCAASTVGIVLADGARAGVRYLSTSARDRAWLALHEAGGPLTIEALTAHQAMRSVRAPATVLARDGRFLYLERRMWDLVERHLTPPMRAGLLPLADGRTVAVEEVARLVRDRLDAVGVRSPTSSGFVVAADEACRQAYGAGLDSAVTAYTVHPVLARHSTLFDTGRRLRVAVRGADVGEQAEAAYWVRRALSTIGQPCTVADYIGQLRALYQHSTHHNNLIGWLKQEVAAGHVGLQRLPYRGSLVVFPPGWAPPDVGPYEVTPRLHRLIYAVAQRHEADPEALLRAGPFAPLFEAARSRLAAEERPARRQSKVARVAESRLAATPEGAEEIRPPEG